jgi:hypothetical protein
MGKEGWARTFPNSFPDGNTPEQLQRLRRGEKVPLPASVDKADKQKDSSHSPFTDRPATP